VSPDSVTPARICPKRTTSLNGAALHTIPKSEHQDEAVEGSTLDCSHCFWQGEVADAVRIPLRYALWGRRSQKCYSVRSATNEASVGVPDDPVTGSSHCVLTPYWAKVLRKEDLHALQVSKRGGELFCRNRGERVRIAGSATLYLEGTISV